MKVCLNCRFYDPSAHWQCRERISEPVREKDRANFCDFFSLRPGNAAEGSAGDGSTAGGTGKADAARDSLRKLFGDD